MFTFICVLKYGTLQLIIKLKKKVHGEMATLVNVTVNRYSRMTSQARLRIGDLRGKCKSYKIIRIGISSLITRVCRYKFKSCDIARQLMTLACHKWENCEWRATNWRQSVPIPCARRGLWPAVSLATSVLGRYCSRWYEHCRAYDDFPFTTLVDISGK